MYVFGESTLQPTAMYFFSRAMEVKNQPSTFETFAWCYLQLQLRWHLSAVLLFAQGVLQKDRPLQPLFRPATRMPIWAFPLAKRIILLESSQAALMAACSKGPAGALRKGIWMTWVKKNHEKS